MVARRADAAPAVRARGARPLRQILRLRAARPLRRRPDRPSARASRHHYARLFEDAPTLERRRRQSRLHRRRRRSRDAGDPAPRSASSGPEAAAETIRGWHFGRRAAVRSPRAREVLTELMPALLDAFSGSGDPDAALAAFDAALARMPGSGRIAVDPALQRAGARIVRRSAWRRAAPRPGRRDAPARARRRDRSRPRRGDFEASLDDDRMRGADRGFPRPRAGIRGGARPRPRFCRRGDVPHRRAASCRARSIPSGRAAPIARSPRG